MIHEDEKSNAQSWELEITCKNKEYLYKVVHALLKYGTINFEVKLVENHSNDDGVDGKYLVFMWSVSFYTLKLISKDLSELILY